MLFHIPFFMAYKRVYAAYILFINPSVSYMKRYISGINPFIYPFLMLNIRVYGRVYTTNEPKKGLLYVALS